MIFDVDTDNIYDVVFIDCVEKVFERSKCSNSSRGDDGLASHPPCIL